MAVLTNKSIASTYKSVLSIGATTESALTSSIQQLTDGLGNGSPLSMSTTQIQFNAGSNTFKFPTTRGTSGQILKLADANGTLGWVADASGDVTKTGTIALNTIAVWNDNADQLRSDTTMSINTNHTISLLQPNSVPTDVNSYNIGGGNIANVTGSRNVGFGKQNLNAVLAGSDNTAMGNGSLEKVTSGNSNTGFGSDALGNSTDGDFNTAVGSGALGDVLTGENNTAVGYNAGVNVSTGSGNTYIGKSAGLVDVGSNNIYIGEGSGSSVASGNNNVILGSNTGNTISATSNNIIISDGSGNNRIQVNSGGNVGIGVTPTTTSKVEVKIIDTSVIGSVGSLLTLKNVGAANIAKFVLGDGTTSDTFITHTGGNSVADQKFGIGINATNKFVLDGNGNVGIGTTSPQQILHINNTSGNFSAEAVLRGSTSTGTPKAEVAFKRATSGDGAGLVLRTSNSSGTLSDSLTISSGGDATFQSASAKSLTGSFNVSINDSTSFAQGVGGGITLGGYKSATAQEFFAAIDGYKENGTSVNAAGAFRILTQPSDGSGLVERMRISSGGETFWGSSPKQAYVYVDTTNDIALIGSLGSGMDLGFITGTGTNKLTITSGGNVGIGTLSTSANSLQKYLSITDNYNVGIILNDTRGSNAFEIFNAGEVFNIAYGSSPKLTISSTGAATFNSSVQSIIQLKSSLEFASIDFFKANGTTKNYEIASNGTTTGTAAESLYFYRGGYRMILSSGGALSTTTGSLGTISSDLRLKKNVTDATSKLDDILSLRVVNFEYKNEDKNGKQLGFIAQEFEKVFPSLVTNADSRKYDTKGNVISGYEDEKGLKVGLDFAVFTKAIQEQQTIIEDLKSRIETLEG